MEKVTLRDREILREIAGRKLAMATCAKNDEIIAKWKKQAAGVRDTPTVRLLFSNFRGEVIDSRLRCEGADARRLESQLLSSLVGRELFDDDTPLSTNFEIPIQEWASPFGTSPKRVKAKDGMGFHIEPLTDDIEADFDIFCKGNYWARPAETRAWAEYADEVFGDILPSHIVQSSLGGMLTNPLVALIGMVLVSDILRVGFSDLSELKGVFLGLGAAVLYATVILLNKKLKDISAYDRTVVQLSAAFAVLVPYVFLTEDVTAISPTPLSIILLLVVGVIHTGLAYALYFGSMDKLPAQTVALYSYIDPILAVLLSALFLKETMSIGGVIGAILILGATMASELWGAEKNE